MDNLIRHDLGNGINLYIIPSSKFKAISIRLFMHQELNENASKTALLPLVLRRGCKGYDTQRKIRIYLDELFGAFFEVGVQKKGERHVMVFGMSIPNEQYIGQENSTLAKAIQFLNRIVMDPVTENGVFLQKYVEQEKVNLTQIIQSLINDKAQYAIERCLQIMCQNERFSHYTYGDLQSLKDITTTNLYDHYERSIASSPIDIFVAGDVSEDQVGSVTEEMIKLTREKIQIIPEEIIKKATGKVGNRKSKGGSRGDECSPGKTGNGLSNQYFIYRSLVFSSRGFQRDIRRRSSFQTLYKSEGKGTARILFICTFREIQRFDAHKCWDR
jgi:predicted Zn-dependent peptidase